MRLDNLDEEMLEGALKGATDGLKKLVDAARALAPVDTGQLRNSISSEARIEGDRVIGKAEAKAEHAVYVEFGTGPRGEAHHEGTAPFDVVYRTKGWSYEDPETKERIWTMGQAAQPFMYPAFLATRDAVYQDVARGVKDASGEV